MTAATRTRTVGDWRRHAALVIDAAGLDTVPALEADVLLGYALGVTRTWLYAHPDAPLEDLPRASADALLSRRLDAEPIAYLVGEKEFRSRAFQVSADVLIPRDDTQTLVDAALQHATALHAHRQRPLVVVDAGTGSGIVAVSLALELPVPATLVAIDRSVPALRVAAVNAHRHGARVQTVAGDWLEAFADASVDLLVSNPPYICRNDPHLPALAFEPVDALVAGKDGLRDIRRLVEAAGRVLAVGGAVLLEHGFDQAAGVRDLLSKAGFSDVETRHDEAGNERVSSARLTRS